jgi:glucose-6-phosphate 1-dehydrogenase
VALEPPVSFEADALRNEKVKVLEAIRPIDLNDTISDV